MSILSKYVDKRIDNYFTDRSIDFHSGLPVIYDKDYIQDCYKLYYNTTDTSQLLYFFKTHYPHYSYFPTNPFYRIADSKMPIIHYPLANLISKTMVNLLFSDIPKISASNDTYSNTLQQILDDNDFDSLLSTAAEYESYSGAVAFKPVLDPTMSNHVILQVYPKEDVDVIKKYGRVTEIIFKDYYSSGKEKYILYTICGKGYIDYHLKKENNKAVLQDVSIDALPETKGLHKVNFYNTDGTPYDRLTAIYKENKADAKSDYANILDDFASLDEVYSCLINFIRRSKIKTYLPENTLKQDPTTGDKIIPTDYDTDNVILYDNNPEGTEQKIQRDIVDINNSIQGYISSFNNILLNALMTTGLSPATVGLDISGANASAEAINIRERASLRTRSEKLHRWKRALTDLSILCLDFDNITISQGNIYVSEYNDDINIEFAEYESPSFDRQVESLGTALDHNLIDLHTALSLLYPKKTVEEINTMERNINSQFPDTEDIENNEIYSNT